MTEKLTLSTIILTTILTSCGQTKSYTGNLETQTYEYKIDSSIIAILPFDTTQYWFFHGNKPIDLTNDDLIQIETILNQAIVDYNPEQERQFKKVNNKHPEYKLDRQNFVIDLTRYKRQYVATINIQGEKEVWVNCFCDMFNQNWRKHRILVMDGGNCYFNLKINLTKGKYFGLMVNGSA